MDTNLRSLHLPSVVNPIPNVTESVAPAADDGAGCLGDPVEAEEHRERLAAGLAGGNAGKWTHCEVDYRDSDGRPYRNLFGADGTLIASGPEKTIEGVANYHNQRVEQLEKELDRLTEALRQIATVEATDDDPQTVSYSIATEALAQQGRTK